MGIPSTTILVGILFPLGFWEQFATNTVGNLFLQRLLLKIGNKPSGNFVPTRLRNPTDCNGKSCRILACHQYTLYFILYTIMQIVNGLVNISPDGV